MQKRAGLSRQNQERCLERILGVGVVADHAPADAKNHGSVTPHQRLESIVIALGGELIEQFRVAAAVLAQKNGPANVSDKPAAGFRRHADRLRDRANTCQWDTGAK